MTHTFVDGDQWLTSDAVFGVKESLIAQFEEVQEDGLQWMSHYDFVLTNLDKSMQSRSDFVT